jgi:universal stress protein A
MSKYKRILLALDLKPEDDEPVSEQAMALARSQGAEVNIIHVVEPIYTCGIPAGGENKFVEMQVEIEQSAKEQLQRIGQNLCVPPAKQFLAVGQIKKQLLRTAETIKADLIVVGCHAKHGMRALFMADTANEMLHNANCDVLVINIPKKTNGNA